jgi:hypothetical protein
VFPLWWDKRSSKTKSGKALGAFLALVVIFNLGSNIPFYRFLGQRVAAGYITGPVKVNFIPILSIRPVSVYVYDSSGKATQVSDCADLLGAANGMTVILEFLDDGTSRTVRFPTDQVTIVEDKREACWT